MHKKLLFSVLLAITLVGCSPAPAIRTAASSNPQVTVEVVAEFEGVRLYRVHDGITQIVYVAVSTTEVRTSWWVSDGSEDGGTIKLEALATHK